MAAFNLKEIGQIFDAIGKLSEEADIQQEMSKRYIIAMHKATEDMNRKTDDLRNQISREVKEALESASTKAAKLITEKLENTNRLADEAAARYRHDVRWATWKILASAVLIGFAIAGGITYVLLESIPSIEVIEKRRAEMESLQSNIDQLKKRGALAKMSNCKDEANRTRRCIKIDEDAGRYEDGYRVIAGY